MGRVGAATACSREHEHAQQQRTPHCPGCGSDDVSTTSNEDPVICPSECRSSFDHFGLGAPLMYQFEPLSARIIPYVFSACSTMRACRGKCEMSTLALRRTRRPIGGKVGSSDGDAKCRAG